MIFIYSFIHKYLNVYSSPGIVGGETAKIKMENMVFRIPA